MSIHQKLIALACIFAIAAAAPQAQAAPLQGPHLQHWVDLSVSFQKWTPHTP